MTLTHTTGTAGVDTFSSVGIDGADNTRLSDTSQRVKITLNAAAIEDSANAPPFNDAGEDDANTALVEGSSVDLTITDQSGASTSYAVNVPSVLEDAYVSV